jgi:predicted enzyme involved in methoxymalonyl-ACP biosynthesis
MNESNVFSFNLVDKFGDLGMVAVVIVVNNNNIDSFLISCRALGRNLEYKILHLIAKNIGDNFFSSYVKTDKNAQVSDFYDKFSITIDRDVASTSYYLGTEDMIDISYIKEEE